DVRSLPMLEAYHTSVQLYKAADEVSSNELQRRVEQGRRPQEEMVVGAGLFSGLGRRGGEGGRGPNQPKAGASDKQVSRFRYDVTISLGAKEEVASPSKWVMWNEAGQWETELEQELARDDGQAVGVRGVRDARAARAVAAVQLLQGAEGSGMNAGQVRS